MGQHTKEPWRVLDYNKTIVIMGKDEGGFDIWACPYPEANARRIVACVNACAGFTTEGLEQCTAEGDTILKRLEGWQLDCMKAEQQRDELLMALKNITEIENQMFGQDWDEIDKARTIANSAIAKAEQS